MSPLEPRPPEGLLDKLHHLQVLVGDASRHERLKDRKYENVRIGLMEASDGILDALEGWPA